jgi:hypothetical protein
MKRVTLVAGVLAFGAVVLSAGVALAAPFDNQPKLMLHIKGVTTKNACTAGEVADCQATPVVQADLGGTSTFYFIYLAAVRGNLENLAGLQCGISYQSDQAGQATDGVGVDIFGWTLCATLEFVQPAGINGSNAWPQPNSGNLITWDALVRCQTGEIAVAGYFYAGAYSADRMSVKKRQADNAAKVADCKSSEAPPLGDEDLGFVQFSAGAITLGCNPCVMNCGGVPVEETTWSGIKTLIGR